jgi:hypothetical protein
LYAYFGNYSEVEEFVFDTISSEKYKQLGIDKLSAKQDSFSKYYEQFFDFVGTSIQNIKAVNRNSYFDEELTDEIFDYIPDVDIETLKIKFFAVATRFVFWSGDSFFNWKFEKST